MSGNINMMDCNECTELEGYCMSVADKSIPKRQSQVLTLSIIIVLCGSCSYIKLWLQQVDLDYNRSTSIKVIKSTKELAL